MSYTTEDFGESLARTTLAPSDIAVVNAAWGSGFGMGEDAGHYRWSEEGASEWHGGFLFTLKDGRIAYLTGWCDYTGWGCQDGVELHFFDVLPDLSTLPPPTEYGDKAPPPDQWDLAPADLNRWLAKP